MNHRRTPPIQWLPVFEMAARSLSFKHAAEALHVSPPAVSQQIKALEDWLGVQLFVRHTRHLSLTTAGEFYLGVAEQVMRAHRQGYLEFQRRFQSTSLLVSAPLFLAQEMLIPNYLSFNDHVPDTELRIEARNTMVDFESEAVDAAIRFGPGHWQNLECRRLCHAAFAPVCSPEYARRHRFERMEDLLEHRLIFMSSAMRDWNDLLGETASNVSKRLVCDSFLSAMKSAADGLGVAVAIFPMCNAWVNAGRLALPFGEPLASQQGYWLVTPKRTAQPAAIEGLFAWCRQLFDELPTLQRKVPTTSRNRGKPKTP